MIRRPQSLAEIVDHTTDYLSFGMSCRDFIGEYKLLLKQGGDVSSQVKAEPALLKDRYPEGNICDAYLAGLADYLTEKHGFVAPSWTSSPSRHLENPWYASELPSVKAHLAKHALEAFRRHNIFTDASVLDSL